MSASLPRSTHGRSAPDILLAGFVGGTGGASSFMRELAAGLQSRGLRTLLAVPEWETTVAFADSAAQLDVPVVRTPWLNLERGRVGTLVEALRFVRAFRAPVVHYHLSENFFASPFLRAMDLLRPPPAFVTMQSPYDEPAADAPPVRRWVRDAPRLFRKVICVSRESGARQRRYGLPEDLTTIIYNGVNIPRFASGDAAIARRALPAVPPGAPLIVSTARVERQKQPLEAVAAFAQIASELPHAHLVFVGRGPLEEATRAAADRLGVGPRVHLVGHQINIPDWLAAATVWLLPTISEAFSLGIIEAMAAGCPIVSTRCPGNDEVLVDGQNALTVAVGDVGAMADALRRTLTDAALRARLGRAARATAARYSLEGVVDQHLAVYGLADRRVVPSPVTSRDVA